MKDLSSGPGYLIQGFALLRKPGLRRFVVIPLSVNVLLFGGLPKANPNPTGAVALTDIIKDKPIINVPGCPPIPEVITGVIANFLTWAP